MVAGDGSPTVDELWLSCQQRLVSRIAHDLKNSLNAVSVNLEVVRSRAERESSTGADVRSFATSAADQTAVVIRATAALLSLGRPPRPRAEVSTIARQIAALVTDSLAGDGAPVEVQVPGGLAAETSAPGNAVRLAIGEAVLAAATAKVPITIEVQGAPTVVARVRPLADPFEPEIVKALEDSGIRLRMDGHGISMSFPGTP